MQYSGLLQHCHPEWLELIDLKKKTIHIKKGKHLFQQGEKVEGIFFIQSGVVKIHVPWVEDKEMIIRFAKAGDIAGHRGLPASHAPIPTYPISATALEDTTASFLTNDFFETTLKANPTLTYALMQFYATELQKAEQKMRNLTHMEVKGRISLALLDIESTFGTGKDKYITLALTRQDIASYAGTTYETVFKFFTELVDRKIISTSGKNIRILKPAALQAYIP
ncbi:MAG: Crp/Fnr family transcriptional regulator [Bacteroidetes bacterium]|nr:Crp/Fnr family transcriptional regulator [Bacteroidota bacterium]